MGNRESDHARRIRLTVASYFAAGVVWVAGFIVYFVAANPSRRAAPIPMPMPPRSFLSRRVDFVIFATPIWLLAFPVLTLIDHLRGK